MQNLALVVFPGLMAFAIFSDLLTLTIPNLVSLILAFSYLAFSAWLGTPWVLVAMHVACCLVVLAITFILFEMRYIGGGDAKLASATALWLGIENLLEYLLVFSIIGGAVALSIMTIRWYDHADRASSYRLLARVADKASNHMPYGVALGTAGVLLYPYSTIWRGLAGL
jgi:prepilin peptidase CpaA